MKRIVIALLGLILMNHISAQLNTEKAEAETTRINNRSLAGYISQDVDTILIAYSDESIIVPPGGNAIYGLEDIRKFYLEGFKAGRSLKISTENYAYELIDSRSARQLGSYRIEYLPKGNEEPISISGNMMILWQKDASGRWKIKWDIWN